MQTWATLIAVGCGGALGAILRWLISLMTFSNSASFPWKTLAANLLGALIIGMIAGAMADGIKLSARTAAFLKTGFCGGLTTFSTFSLESLTLFENKQFATASVYLVCSVVFSLLFVYIGKLSVHAFCAH